MVWDDLQDDLLMEVFGYCEIQPSATNSKGDQLHLVNKHWNATVKIAPVCLSLVLAPISIDTIELADRLRRIASGAVTIKLLIGPGWWGKFYANPFIEGHPFLRTVIIVDSRRDDKDVSVFATSTFTVEKKDDSRVITVIQDVVATGIHPNTNTAGDMISILGGACGGAWYKLPGYICRPLHVVVTIADKVQTKVVLHDQNSASAQWVSVPPIINGYSATQCRRCTRLHYAEAHACNIGVACSNYGLCGEHIPATCLVSLPLLDAWLQYRDDRLIELFPHWTEEEVWDPSTWKTDVWMQHIIDIVIHPEDEDDDDGGVVPMAVADV